MSLREREEIQKMLRQVREQGEGFLPIRSVKHFAVQSYSKGYFFILLCLVAS